MAPAVGYSGRPVYKRRERGCNAVVAVPSGESDLEAGATDRALELDRGTFGDRPPVVDHDDIARKLVSLVEVLGREQDRHALVAEVPNDLPDSARLVGSRPVVGSSRKSTGGRVTRLAARSRRRRIPPSIPCRAAASVREIELIEQLVGPQPGRARLMPEFPDHDEVLEPGQ